jgi:Tfp pilus assembly protein PilF
MDRRGFSGRTREFSFPPWDGSPPSGKTLLLYAEKGLGDAIQFVRYAGVLAAAGATVVVECPKELMRLFRNAGGVSRVVATGDAPGACDFACAMMSLPALLGTTLEALPAEVPYLDVDLPLLEKWRGRVDRTGSGFRVGLVWRGRTRRWNEHDHAVSLEVLRPLVEVGGVTAYSLQPSRASMEPKQNNFPMVDFTGEFGDFADTAALILNLDLVIGLDTAVVHLAGALGKPVWTILPHDPDRRWLTGRQDSPWYPTMTLFRQEEAGDAVSLVAAVREQLSRVGRRAPAVPSRPSTLSPEQARMIAQGIGRHREGNLAGAWALYRQALEGGAADAGLYANVGLLQTQVGREADAGDWFARALRMDPDNTAALNNLALQMVREGRAADARKLFQRALRSDPGSASLMNNIGITLAGEQNTGGEISWFRNAVRADGMQVDGHWNLAQAALSHGLLSEGWQEYEWRWQKSDFTGSRQDLKMPRWDGSPLAGRSLFVHAEQGFGDTVQFCRYLSHPGLAGGDIVAEVPEELASLMRRSFGSIAVILRGEQVPHTDLHVPLMSIPHLVGTTMASIPARVPYLTADPEAVTRWETRLGSSSCSPRIGIVWRGRPTHRLDRTRSIQLRAMEEMFCVPGIQWFSLQMGEASKELHDQPLGMEVIRDLSGELVDFAETAAVLSGLDLLVTVDTAVAHLAGALGKPVWVLLPTPADWRWMRRRVDSPWYPSMELFRQAGAGQWDGVIRRVVERLRSLPVAGGGDEANGPTSA